MPVRECIASVLEERLLRGDFRLTGFPGERELAREVGVSRTTTRLALSDLLDRGVLVRQPNGRVIPRTDAGPLSEVKHVAYLRPANGFANPQLDRVAHLGREMGVHVRSVEYIDWDDPILRQTIESFDGTFLEPPAERAPEPALRMLRSAGTAVVVVHRDFSEQGIRSLDLAPAGFSGRLLDHLHALGHRRIACLNTQPEDESMTARICAWTLWKAARGVEGTLLNEPVPSYGDPVQAAYRVVSGVLAGGHLAASALWCTTPPAAIGAMRAAKEHGLRIGSDLSVAALNDEGINRFLLLSLTSIRVADADAHHRLCLEWMRAGGSPADWTGPLLLRPADAEVFEGESTGPPSA